MLSNDMAPLKYQVYKGIGGKFGAVQFTASHPHFFCTKNRKHKFYRGELVQQANFSKEIHCPTEQCGGVLSSREGCVFVEMAPTTAPNTYDWSQKIMFALSIKDIGQLLLAMQKKESAELTHDPQAGTEHKGQVVKKLSYYVKDASKGALLSLTESKKGEENKKSFMVPMTADEVLILNLLMRSFVSSMLAWQ